MQGKRIGDTVSIEISCDINGIPVAGILAIDTAIQLERAVSVAESPETSDEDTAGTRSILP